MVIQCPECAKKYKIDPDKIPDKGAKISCPECGHSFVVKKKEKEAPAEPKTKTPPCVMCGNPSTRVLKGDPPLVLCEACFEREKEKRRRFEVQPSFTDFSGDSAEPEAQADSASEAEPELSVRNQEGAGENYFDSFAEVPDLGDFEPEPGTSPPKPAKPAAPPPPPPPPKTDSKPKIEKPVFEESGFEPPARAISEPAREEPRTKNPNPESEREEPTDDQADPNFVFSPDEVSGGEDTGPTETKAPPPVPNALHGFRPAGPDTEADEAQEFHAAPPPVGDLDKEIFGDIAAKEKTGEALAASASKKKRKGKPLKIPVKAVVGVAAALIVIAGGFFLFTNPKVRSAISGLSSGLVKNAPPKILTDEDRKVLAEHITMASDLYRLDTRKNYVDALNEISAALKIDPQSGRANDLQMLVSSLLAYREGGWLLTMRAKGLVKKAAPKDLEQPEAQAAKVLVSLLSQDVSMAQITAKNLVEGHPDDALANWVYAAALLDSPSKNLEQVEPLLLKAVESDPKLVQARFSLAELYLAKKDYPGATAQFSEVLKLSPDRTQAADRIKDIEVVLRQNTKPTLIGTKPGEPGGLLLTPGSTQQGNTGTIPIVTRPGGTEPTALSGVDQEIQKHIFGVIAETRKPMSRVRAHAEPQPAVVPGTTSHPPEESPGSKIPEKPPEEAP